MIEQLLIWGTIGSMLGVMGIAVAKAAQIAMYVVRERKA